MGSKADVVGLYRRCLRLAQSFTDYNMRHYSVRVIKQDFRALGSSSTDEQKLTAYTKGLEQAEMLKRQTTLYAMFAPNVRPHVAEVE